MKTIILFAMLACSCAVSKTNTPSNQKLDDSFYTPPNTIDMFLSDKQKSELEVAKTEQAQYDESLDNITQKVREQALNLAICNAAAPNKSECGILKNNYCQVDMLLDTRGGHHIKPFCR